MNLANHCRQAHHAGMPGHETTQQEFGVFDAIPARLLLACRVVPVPSQDGGFVLLADESSDKAAVENIAANLGLNLRFRMLPPDELDRELAAMHAHCISDEAEAVGNMVLREPPTPYFSGMRQQYVETLAARALAEGASDIHIQPGADGCSIRLRVDGRLRTIEKLSTAAAAPLTAQIKVLARLPLTEKRLPHDGRLRVQTEGRNVDMRVSILPSIHGEAVVLRLESGDAPSSLDELYMPGSVRECVNRLLTRRDGLFLVGGPTGSGKTSTLYAMMRALCASERKLISVEDPVERILPGVGQVPVEEGGMGFGDSVRAMLRHSPDAILIGEIRDSSTAAAAAEAALTGHLVLASVHARDATEAILRLVDLGVSRHTIACVLEAALTQRLLRLLCPACSTEGPIPLLLAKALGFPPDTIVRHRTPGGCPECHGNGFAGRRAIFGLIMMEETLRNALAGGGGAHVLCAEALRNGMPTLRDGAKELVRDGLADAAEALSVMDADEASDTLPPSP